MQQASPTSGCHILRISIDCAYSRHLDDKELFIINAVERTYEVIPTARHCAITAVSQTARRCKVYRGGTHIIHIGVHDNPRALGFMVPIRIYLSSIHTFGNCLQHLALSVLHSCQRNLAVVLLILKCAYLPEQRLCASLMQ